MEGNYFSLNDLEAYKLARDFSRLVWDVYSKMNWQERKIIGDQVVRSVDSVGANIAEGYGRFHYLDKNKFYYNARGSLLESKHWMDLLFERKMINNIFYVQLCILHAEILRRLNGLIKSQFIKNKNSN